MILCCTNQRELRDRIHKLTQKYLMILRPHRAKLPHRALDAKRSTHSIHNEAHK